MLSADAVTVRFRWPGGPRVTALRDVSLSLGSGDAIGIVGESGSGKSTLLRVLVGLIRPQRGSAALDGVGVIGRRGAELMELRRAVQLVQQDPYLALNSRQRIRAILGQPLRLHRGLRGRAAEQASGALLTEVGLSPAMLDRFPDAFSGGQRQRIALARALSVTPKYLLLDEPLSALDPRSADGVLALIERISSERGLGVLLVSHDLEPVRRLTRSVLVMRDGVVVEHGPTVHVLSRPRSGYAQELLAAE